LTQSVNFVARWRSGMAMPELYVESPQAAYSDRGDSNVRDLLSRQHLAAAMDA
jgi:hypothetical protein